MSRAPGPRRLGAGCQGGAARGTVMPGASLLQGPPGRGPGVKEFAWPSLSGRLRQHCCHRLLPAEKMMLYMTTFANFIGKVVLQLSFPSFRIERDLETLCSASCEIQQKGSFHSNPTRKAAEECPTSQKAIALISHASSNAQLG